MSLSNSPLTTMIPVTDAGRARKFYEDSLGLPFREQGPDGNFVFTLDGTGALALFSDPEAKPSPHTAASFEVKDIPKVIDELEGRGVVFEDYDLPDLKTTGHICDLGSEKAAWFKDPDGNILCLHENTA